MTGRRRGRIEESAGGVVVRELEGVPHMLIIRDPYEKWGLPKGHSEKGESLQEAALREVSEETGLSDLELGPELVTIDWRFRTRGTLIHKFATFYLMFSRLGDPVPERAEGITEAKWVRLDKAHEDVSYENATEVVRAAQDYVLNGDDALS
jgi:ADP-ribose pyrophosphatase YjhB (NUDIX family)